MEPDYHELVGTAFLRVIEHLLIASAGAALAAPWAGDAVVPALAASVLIDTDHYLWFVLSGKGGNLGSAVRYFNGPDVPESGSTRALHHPCVMLALGTCSVWRQQLRPIVIGMALHVLLDKHQRRRLRQARLAALRRDEFMCQRCRVRGVEMTAHQWRTTPLLTFPRSSQMITLCARCHWAVHCVDGSAGSSAEFAQPCRDLLVSVSGAAVFG